LSVNFGGSLNLWYEDSVCSLIYKLIKKLNSLGVLKVSMRLSVWCLKAQRYKIYTLLGFFFGNACIFLFTITAMHLWHLSTQHYLIMILKKHQFCLNVILPWILIYFIFHAENYLSTLQRKHPLMYVKEFCILSKLYFCMRRFSQDGDYSVQFSA
jgi:hypothetical protein